MNLSNIPAPTLGQKVDAVEYQRDRLNTILGELIAVCLLNLDNGSIKCDDPAFVEFVKTRNNLRVQIMHEADSFSQATTKTTETK